MAFLIGKKLNMTQIWQDEKVIPVTLIKVEPLTITALRTKEKDGYSAAQISDGKFKKEFSVSGINDFKIGDEIKISSLKEGDLLKITGISKGKGFQGVVKRHGFGGGPKTHGQKNRYRAPGSIGSTAFQRVVPGRKMAGRAGGEKITIKNLKVVSVDSEKNILAIRGAVAGSKGAVLAIQTVK